MSTISNELFNLVKLYRLLGKPDTSDFSFQADITLNCDILDVLADLWAALQKQSNCSVVDIELTVQPFSISSDDESTSLNPNLIGQNCTITVRLRQNSEIRFYNSITHLVEKSISSKRFSLPEFYYLIDLDYCHGLDEVNAQNHSIKTAQSLFKFIEDIQKLAASVDIRKDPVTATFYMSNPDEKAEIKPVDLLLDFSSELLDIALPSFDILKQLVQEEITDKHAYERKIILKTVLCETLLDVPIGENQLDYIVTHWIVIDEKYHRNWETFITGISFNKLKHEIQEKSIEILDKANSSLIDVSLKLTAVPAAFGLMIFVIRDDHTTSKLWAFLVALTVMTLMLSLALSTHRRKLAHIETSTQNQLAMFKEKFEHSEKEQKLGAGIKEQLQDSEDSLVSNLTFVKRQLTFFFFALWFPVIALLCYILVEKHEVQKWLLCLLTKAF